MGKLPPLSDIRYQILCCGGKRRKNGRCFLFCTFLLCDDWPESTINSGKADVVFTIDTTGSMGWTIYNAIYNIKDFVDKLAEKKVDVRLGLVEYKDIDEDGLQSTKDHGWFNDVESFKAELEDLWAYGGGDWPESVVDALEMSRLKDYRSSVNKYIILVTDADYKEQTRYEGLYTMEEEISRLKHDGIRTVVVSDMWYNELYKPLYSETIRI